MEVAKKVCKEMLEQRQWKIVTDISTFQDNEMFSGTIDDKKTYNVLFLMSPKLNIANIKDCIKFLQENNVQHCIIVYNNNITSSAKRVIANFVDITFELFAVDDLQTNITKHYYVPKHTKLNNKEEIEFKTKMGVDIPILSKTDKVCRFYNFARGDIIKVNRLDGSVAYRIVK